MPQGGYPIPPAELVVGPFGGEFDLVNKLAHGGSEGIYLDLWIEYYVNNKREKKRLGTFKTLHEDDDAMHVMAGLLADFIIEGSAYVNEHLDDLTWEGVDVYAFDENGKRYSWGYTCCGMETALHRKDELLNETVSIPQLSWGNNRCKWR